MNGIGYYINLLKPKTKMSTTKEEALKRLDALDKESKELRKIIEAPEVKGPPTTLKEACEQKGIDHSKFLESISGLSKSSQGFEKLKLIIGVIRGAWKPTPDNKWFYPVMKRTKAGFSFFIVFYDGDDHYYNVVPASLTLENSKDAEYVGKTFTAEYNEYMMPE